jgi:cystathionine beta-lyase family protein involved in aluminum resistance
MQALSRHAASEGRPGARLLIVTGQPDQSLAENVHVHAEKHGVKTEWLLYRVSIELSDAT